MPKSRLTALVFVLIASSAFATAGPLARLSRPADPLFVAAARVVIAGVLLACVNPAATFRALRALPRATLGKVFFVGALLGAHFALFLSGLDHTSLAAGVSLVALEPLSVVIWAWLLFRVKPSRAEQLGVLLATAGAIVVAQAAGKGDHQLFGDALVVGSVALFGLYVASARALKDVMPARSYVAAVYLSAAVALLMILPVIPMAAGTTRDPGTGSWAAILGLALIPTLIGHTAVQTAARSLPPAIVSLVSPGETAGGIAIGVLFMKATLAPAEVVGALLILAGVLVAIFAVRSGEARSAEVPSQSQGVSQIRND